MRGKGICAIALGVLTGLAGVARGEQGVTGTTIEIGAFGPITGPAAYIGLGGRDGANLAVKKMVDEDHVFAIFCVAGSNGTIGSIDYLKESGRVMYVSFASAPGVTWPFARNLFRGGTTEVPRYGELYAEFIADQMQARKVAIMSGREEYPKNEGDALTKQLQSWFNTTPVVRVEFNIGDKDFTSQLLQVQQAQPQAIAFFGNPAEAAIAMRQARELGLNQPFFVGVTMVDQNFIAAARQTAEGASGFALVPLLPGSDDATLKAW